jgi:catechol-2,3-dioxygenase
MRTAAPLRLTHGALEVTDIEHAMAFYREFLGLEVTHHMPKGCPISLGGDFYVICLEVPHAHDMPLLNHFGLDCASRDAVDAWHARALGSPEDHRARRATRGVFVLHQGPRGQPAGDPALRG